MTVYNHAECQFYLQYIMVNVNYLQYITQSHSCKFSTIYSTFYIQLSAIDAYHLGSWIVPLLLTIRGHEWWFPWCEARVVIWAVETPAESCTGRLISTGAGKHPPQATAAVPAANRCLDQAPVVDENFWVEAAGCYGTWENQLVRLGTPKMDDLLLERINN